MFWLASCPFFVRLGQLYFNDVRLSSAQVSLRDVYRPQARTSQKRRPDQWWVRTSWQENEMSGYGSCWNTRESKPDPWWVGTYGSKPVPRTYRVGLRPRIDRKWRRQAVCASFHVPTGMLRVLLPLEIIPWWYILPTKLCCHYGVPHEDYCYPRVEWSCLFKSMK